MSDGPKGQIVFKNQFGEESVGAVISVDQKFSDTQLPKTLVAALVAIPTPGSATAAQCATAINLIIAALQELS